MVNFEEAKMLHERGKIPEAMAAYDVLLNSDFGNYEILFYYGTARKNRTCGKGAEAVHRVQAKHAIGLSEFG